MPHQQVKGVENFPCSIFMRTSLLDNEKVRRSLAARSLSYKPAINPNKEISLRPSKAANGPDSQRAIKMRHAFSVQSHQMAADLVF